MRYMIAGSIMRGWKSDDDEAFNHALEKLWGHKRFAGFGHTAIAWIIYDDLPKGRGLGGAQLLARDVSIETLEYRLKHNEGHRDHLNFSRTRPFAILDRSAEDWARLAAAIGAQRVTASMSTVPVDCLRQAVLDDWADAVHGWDVRKVAQGISTATLHWRMMFPFGPPRPAHFTGKS